MSTALSLVLHHDRRAYDWLVTLLTLQGIANRDEPRVYFDARELADWIRADRVRRKLNERDYGIVCRTVRDRRGLLVGTRDVVRGAVLYDAKLDASRWIAVTLAALEDLLPLTPAQRRDMPYAIDVVHDLRGRWDDGPAAYRWAIRHVLPRCDRRIAYNAGHSHDDVDMGIDPGIITALDYAVRRRGFVFNLSPCAKPGKYADHHVPGYPDDVRLFRTILRKLDAPAAIFGWAEPEWTLTTLLNEHDHYLMCGRAANLSFHAAIRPQGRAPRFGQSPAGPMPRLEKKCYLAFMTSEGDTPRVTSSFFMGGWCAAQRGRFPMNWGLNPLEAALMPAHVEHFYRTATPNDYLYSGVGGAGYVFVNRLRNPALYIDHAAPHLRRAGLDVVEIWQNGEPAYDTYERYAWQCRLRGIVHLPKGPPHVHRLRGGTPIVFMAEGLVHHYGTPRESADRIRAVVQAQGLPQFIPVYRSPRPNIVRECMAIARELDPDVYEPVRLDVMMHLARQATRRS